jgi:maleate isomerase
MDPLNLEPAARPVRIGFLVPPGNPTVEVEMIALAPARVSVHFTRMVAHDRSARAHGARSRQAGRLAGVTEPIAGFGRLLAG